MSNESYARVLRGVTRCKSFGREVSLGGKPCIQIAVGVDDDQRLVLARQKLLFNEREAVVFYL